MEETILIQEEIDIVVKTVNNVTYPLLRISSITSILALKSLVSSVTNIPEERQRLIYRGRVLEDERSIHDYQIMSGHTLHMVARPENFRELQNQAFSSTTNDINNGSNNQPRTSMQSFGTSQILPVSFQSLSSGSQRIASFRNPTNNSGGNGNSNAIPATQAPSNPNSLEHIRQGMLTLNTILSTISPHSNAQTLERQTDSQNQHIDSSSSRDITMTGITYYMGQWLDVKDTVNQWLEATVIDINEEQRQVLIHYNGWPIRWDEWISFDSQRIAPFRTRTHHALNSFTSSPSPTTPVSNAPITGADDIRTLLPHLLSLIQCAFPLIERASQLSSESSSRAETDEVLPVLPSTDDESQDIEQSLMSSRTALQDIFNTFQASTASTSTITPDVNESESTEASARITETSASASFPAVQIQVRARGMPWNSTAELSQVDEDSEQAAEGASASTPPDDVDEELRRICNDLCPIFDRLGRTLTDISPHLLRFSNRNMTSVNSTSSSITDAHPNPLSLPLPVPSSATLSSSDATTTALESALASLLRPRPPSPPHQQAFRTPIQVSARSTTNGSISGFSTDLSGVENNTSTPGGNHLDIHIAIIAPQRRLAGGQLSNISSQIQNILQTSALPAAANNSTSSSSSSSPPPLPLSPLSPLPARETQNTPASMHFPEPPAESSLTNPYPSSPHGTQGTSSTSALLPSATSSHSGHNDISAQASSRDIYKEENETLSRQALDRHRDRDRQRGQAVGVELGGTSSPLARDKYDESFDFFDEEQEQEHMQEVSGGLAMGCEDLLLLAGAGEGGEDIHRQSIELDLDLDLGSNVVEASEFRWLTKATNTAEEGLNALPLPLASEECDEYDFPLNFPIDLGLGLGEEDDSDDDALDILSDLLPSPLVPCDLPVCHVNAELSVDNSNNNNDCSTAPYEEIDSS